MSLPCTVLIKYHDFNMIKAQFLIITIPLTRLCATPLHSRCYKVNRAKREKTLPDMLGKDEIKRILDVAAKDLRFFCIFSILYSAGLRISELLELKPGDINESRNLIRVRQGKGRKDRYTLLSRPLMKKLAEYNRLYRPQSSQAGRTLYGKHRVETAEGRRTGGGHHQADLPAPAAPLLCHAPAGTRYGHQDSEGTDGA